MQDREQREVEHEERDPEDDHQAMARIADADLDRAVVLVELERSQRFRGRGLSDRDEQLEDLDVLLAAPAHRPRLAPVGKARGSAKLNRVARHTLRIGSKRARAEEKRAEKLIGESRSPFRGRSLVPPRDKSQRFWGKNGPRRRSVLPLVFEAWRRR